MYRYFGILIGRIKAEVVLSSVVLCGDSHVAVWSGVNSGVQHWIQGGIELQPGDEDHPCAYIEVGQNGMSKSFRSWRVEYGQKVVVRLRRMRGGVWQCVVTLPDGKGKVAAAKVGRFPKCLATLEIMGKASAVGRINGKVVGGRG